MNQTKSMSKPRSSEADPRQDLLDWIGKPSFPCVGAKSALANGKLDIVVARSLLSSWNDVELHERLLQWAKDYRANPSGFRSLAILFAEPAGLSEEDFEKHMWTRIQSFSDKDAWLGQDYDDAVSADPENPHFSLSFGGEAFFVVGLHANASRPARRFRYPTLIFNLHDQFETLRANGKYERMRETILNRDVKLAGDVNPMLARHGEASEAAQYSGRVTGDDWVCPFNDSRKG